MYHKIVMPAGGVTALGAATLNSPVLWWVITVAGGLAGLLALLALLPRWRRNNRND